MGRFSLFGRQLINIPTEMFSKLLLKPYITTILSQSTPCVFQVYKMGPGVSVCGFSWCWGGLFPFWFICMPEGSGVITKLKGC
jgi:hypothetical protein